MNGRKSKTVLRTAVLLLLLSLSLVLLLHAEHGCTGTGCAVCMQLDALRRVLSPALFACACSLCAACAERKRVSSDRAVGFFCPDAGNPIFGKVKLSI